MTNIRWAINFYVSIQTIWNWKRIFKHTLTKTIQTVIEYKNVIAVM